MAILLKACKPDNFALHNSLKLGFANIWGLRSCESFFESNYPDILALCETNLNDSIDPDNFSVTGYLSLIWKDSSTHMHVLAVYAKEGLPFPQDLSLENSVDSPLLITFFLFVQRFLILFHLKIRFSQSTHLLIFLSSETLTSITRTGLLLSFFYLKWPYSDG